MDNKYKKTLKNVEKLNNLFLSLDLDTNENLDAIAMFLSLLLHKKIIKHEVLDHIPVLAKQLVTGFELIDSLQKQ